MSLIFSINRRPLQKQHPTQQGSSWWTVGRPGPSGDERSGRSLRRVCAEPHPSFPSGFAPRLSFPLSYTSVLLPSPVLSTSGLSRDTRPLSWCLRLPFVRSRRFPLESKAWVWAWVCYLNCVSLHFSLGKDSVVGPYHPENDSACGRAH